MEELDLKVLKELIDNVYDEIFIWDNQYRVVYANKACYRHYGVTAEEIIGRTLEELQGQEQLWSPTSVPYIFKEKIPVIQRQKTFFGIEIDTISIPILDRNNEIKFVVQSVRDNKESLYKMLSPIKMDSNNNTIADDKIVYTSKQMKDVISYCKKVAVTQAPILILGETGTGKSMLAKYIHNKSAQSKKPFIYVNVASINPSVIESEFFGYQKGSFTGANADGKRGFFHEAKTGTIFLDEIGELPYDLQAKFLHVIQEEEFFPLGSTSAVKLDARIICATNCDLQKMIEAGRFREDLYHRLNVFEITIPPLRNRKDDIKLFASHFLNIFNSKYEKSVIFSDRCLESLIRYPWKGNVRELSNVVERCVLVASGKYIEITDFPDSFFSMDNSKYQLELACEDQTYGEMMEAFERRIVEKAFRQYKSSRKVAEALNISQSKANRLRQKYSETDSDMDGKEI